MAERVDGASDESEDGSAITRVEANLICCIALALAILFILLERMEDNILINGIDNGG
jgi:hypothetical protein